MTKLMYVIVDPNTRKVVDYAASTKGCIPKIEKLQKSNVGEGGQLPIFLTVPLTMEQLSKAVYL